MAFFKDILKSINERFKPSEKTEPEQSPNPTDDVDPFASLAKRSDPSTEKFEEWLLSQGRSPNSVRSYMSSLNYVLNDAQMSFEQFADQITSVWMDYYRGGKKENIGNHHSGACKAVVKQILEFTRSNKAGQDTVQDSTLPPQGSSFTKPYSPRSATSRISVVRGENSEKFKQWLLDQERSPNSVQCYTSALNKVLKDANMSFEQFATIAPSVKGDYYSNGPKSHIGKQVSGACRAVVQQLAEYATQEMKDAPNEQPSTATENIIFETVQTHESNNVNSENNISEPPIEQTDNIVAEEQSEFNDLVFVSYSRADKKIVYPLVEKLQKEVGTKFWLDLNGIESGDQFVDRIVKALDKAKFILFMHSTSSLKSEWTKKEIMYAADEGKKIIPLLIDDTKLGGWFKFQFGGTDFIDPKNEDQYNKLVKNLRGWIGID
jgi:hypothetical protein